MKGASFIRSPLVSCSALGLLALGPGISSASPVTISISAQVSYVEDYSNMLGGAIAAGSTVTGTYTYDTATPGSGGGSVGNYWHSAPGYGVDLTAGGFSFKTDPSNVQFLIELVNDLSGMDNYLLRSYNNLPLSNGAPVTHISWQLDDPTASALSNTTLAATPPNLSDWQSIFGLTFEGRTADYSKQYFVRAHVTSAQVVPLPGALWLFGGALSALGWFRRPGRRWG